MFFSTGERSGGVGVGGKLERALMDGRERTTIVSTNIVFPHGVAVDAPNRRVYWVDTWALQSDHIGSCDYNGHNRKTVFRSTSAENLYGLTVFQNLLYLPSWKEKAIMQSNKLHPSNLSV